MSGTPEPEPPTAGPAGLPGEAAARTDRPDSTADGAAGAADRPRPPPARAARLGPAAVLGSSAGPTARVRPSAIPARPVQEPARAAPGTGLAVRRPAVPRRPGNAPDSDGLARYRPVADTADYGIGDNPIRYDAAADPVRYDTDADPLQHNAGDLDGHGLADGPPPATADGPPSATADGPLPRAHPAMGLPGWAQPGGSLGRALGADRPLLRAGVVIGPMAVLFLAGNLASGWLHSGVLIGLSFLVGCVAATWFARQRDLLRVIVAPPVLFLVTVLCAQVMTAPGSTTRAAAEAILAGVFLTLSAAAPWLFAGMLAALLIAFPRGLRQCARQLRSDLHGEGSAQVGAR
ncbi:MAG: DUF6542 domain-containing protein, partial [Streptosporangiaceae bacterium]